MNPEEIDTNQHLKKLHYVHKLDTENPMILKKETQKNLVLVTQVSINKFPSSVLKNIKNG